MILRLIPRVVRPAIRGVIPGGMRPVIGRVIPPVMRWGAWPVRRRLVLAIIGLAAAGLLLANAAGLVLLRGHLVDRVDDQLRAPGEAAARLPADAAAGDRQAVEQRFGRHFRVYYYDARGRLVRTVPADPDPPGPVLADPRPGPPYTVDDPGGGAPWRVLVYRDGAGLVANVASLEEVESVQGRLLLIDAAVSGFVLLLLGALAALVVRLGLRPLTRMEATAGQIAAGDFARRVPVAGPRTEPGRLGAAMNVMLDRLEAEIAARAASEERMRQFLADASHELRTPLTSVRGFAELYRRGGAPPGRAMDETMRRIEDEATRMSLLVGDLLLLAELDEERPLDTRPVDLLEVAADTIRDARARVPGRRVRLSALDREAALEPVVVPGDEARIRQVAANLVANALAHTPPDAEITVRVGTVLARRPGAAVVAGADLPDGRPAGVIEVSDTGPGVPPEHAPRVFERLYRAGRGRSRADGGAGLGLAIVAAIVRAHGGRVELDTRPARAVPPEAVPPEAVPPQAMPPQAVPSQAVPPDAGAARGATFRVLLPLTGDSEPAPR
ncbi:two-component system OmpR family sensor kinase [Thermocatellispora tengchongensis]|uniref:histidine kinase n=1 Tax=Thermocatellispora tengchongensis TaxID=1073253 RepID=A0A840NTS1_9ACTN|nr:ATP-binding protein [Thermocatellispora tengchongensis]MBB5130652.1 two-component system OmpR family sensor kinase [Thermocatellispora tengchongensis]